MDEILELAACASNCKFDASVPMYIFLVIRRLTRMMENTQKWTDSSFFFYTWSASGRKWRDNPSSSNYFLRFVVLRFYTKPSKIDCIHMYRISMQGLGVGRLYQFPPLTGSNLSSPRRHPPFNFPQCHLRIALCRVLRELGALRLLVAAAWCKQDIR